MTQIEVQIIAFAAEHMNLAEEQYVSIMHGCTEKQIGIICGNGNHPMLLGVC